MKLQAIIASAVLSLATSTLSAAPAPWGVPPLAGRPALQQQQPGPETLVRRGMGQLVAFLRQQPGPDSEQVARFLHQEIAPYFDFAYMTKWALGKRYRYLDEGQRVAAQRRLEKMFLSAMAQRLGGYQDQRVKFFPPRREPGNEVSVSVGLLQPGNYPARITFRFYRAGDGWRVFDVEANGSSAVAHYRQYFSRMARAQSPRPY